LEDGGLDSAAAKYEGIMRGKGEHWDAGRTELADHSNERHACAMLPDVQREYDSGTVESQKFDVKQFGGDEKGLRAGVLFRRWIQRGVLLQRGARDEVALQTGDAWIPGSDRKF